VTRFHRTAIFTLILIAICAFALHGTTRHVAIAAIAVCFATIFGLAVPFVRMQYFCPAVIRGKTGGRRVAVTFDDGPDPAATPALLELLKRENVPAAFFLIGRNVDAHPELARRIAEEGHLIGNHTYTHRWQNTLCWARAIARDIMDAQDAIERATGSRPVHFRPPVGLTTPHFQTALTRVRLQLIAWDVRPRDSIRPAAAVIEHVVKNVRDGSIIILHDGNAPRDKITGIVEAVIRELRGRGFALVRLDELLESPARSL
jgi:peptidoglycan/xylan/chitin deacetylase (PgdA/CDA1 family)